MITITETAARFVGTGCFLEVRILTVIRNKDITSSRYSAIIFNKTTNSELAVTELYPESQWEPVADSLEPPETNGQYHTRVGNLIVATIYLQLIQNRYMFRSFTVLQCSHQHCLQPVASDVEVVGYL